VRTDACASFVDRLLHPRRLLLRTVPIRLRITVPARFGAVSASLLAASVSRILACDDNDVVIHRC